MTFKSPELLTSEQRLFFTQIPDDFPAQEIARYYTLSVQDLGFIAQHRGGYNRMGVAVQLCVLRYPGRPLTDLLDIPRPILHYIAAQIDVPPDDFFAYGKRQATVSEHLERIRKRFGFRDYDWQAMLATARHLLPQALENHRNLPLINSALIFLRERQIIAPAMSTIERLVWGVGRIARRWITQWMTEDLSEEQCRLLDSLLEPDSDLADHTRLSWLRAAPAAPSSRHLNRLLDRFLFVSSLRLPPVTPRMEPNRLRDLARQCSRYSAQALSNLHDPAWRYTLLRAHLSALSSDLCDDALDMLDRFHGDLLQKGERQQERVILRSARQIHRDLHILATAADAFLRAKLEELNPFETVFAEIDEQTLAATIISAREAARPPDLDYLDLIEQRYVRRRKVLLRLYQSLQFKAVLGQDPALDALEHVRLLEAYGKRAKTVEQKIEDRYVQAPLEHLGRTRWRKHALHYNKINPNYYEMAAFDRLRAGLRSGDVIVTGSRRYQAFDSYLIPRPQWEAMCNEGQTGLAITGSAQDYLEMINQETEESAARLLAELADNDSLSVDEDGKLTLRRLEKAAPDEAKTLHRQLYDLLPLIQLPDLLIEVDTWTDFFDQLVHLTTGEPVSHERKLALIATVMALGMNIGLEKMAQATGFSYSDLAWAEAWFIREETLVQALAILDNFVLSLSLAQIWGGGTASSSDGIRIPVGVSSAHADYHPHRLAWRRGINVVTHVADIGVPFGPIAICAANREGLHVVDALCHHDADLDIKEHYTDEGGASFHVFALCRLLGFRFIPHLKDMDERILYTTRDVVLDPPLSHLQRPLRITRLEKNWDEMQRTGSSILHGTGSAALIMGKLASYRRQNTLAGAYGDMGKLERTSCILNLLCDETMRRHQRGRLNWHEGHNSLAKALFIGQQGEFRDRSFEDQFHRASCLMLLTAAIAAWNTVYLQKAIDALRAQGVEIPVDLLKHVAPFGWEHINLLGRYDFDLRQARTLDNLRNLRLRGLLRRVSRE